MDGGKIIGGGGGGGRFSKSNFSSDLAEGSEAFVVGFALINGLTDGGGAFLGAVGLSNGSIFGGADGLWNGST